MTSTTRLENHIHYDVMKIERDKRELIAAVKTLDEARNIVGAKHTNSDLPLFWLAYGLSYIGMTADGQNPNTPFVARWLLQRSA